MRPRVLILGLIPLVLGIYLNYWGTGAVSTFALSLGNPSTKMEPHKPLLLTVEPNNYTYTAIPISTDKLRTLQGSYAATGELSLYIMNRTEYEAWKKGKPTPVELSIISTTGRNFTLIPDSLGTYYIVLDNRMSDKAKSVTLSLIEEVRTVETSPLFNYLPLALVLIGIILVSLGLRGRKKSQTR